MRYLEQRKARIEIVPMIDIMFFLLVFFVMVTLKMIPASGIAAQLPHASTAEPIPHPKLLVMIEEDGTVKADQQVISLPDLTAKLSQSGQAKDISVTIASAKTVTVQRMMAVMDACRLAGVTQLGLAATPQPQP